MRFSERQLRTIVHALRIAADQYVADSRVATDAGEARISEQFMIQRNEADSLADLIEEQS
jgi:hypothetical protein